MDIMGDYYPELVWQFYANMEDKQITGIYFIRTFVKGVSIELTSDFLAHILTIPNDGPPVVYNQYDTVLSDSDYDIHQATLRLNYRRVQTGSRFTILLTYIPLIDRLICYFISANIIPRKSCNNEVHNMDVYIVDKLLNGLGEINAIHVATMMIAYRYVTHMASSRNEKNHAPFAITISRILAVLVLIYLERLLLAPL